MSELDRAENFCHEIGTIFIGFSVDKFKTAIGIVGGVYVLFEKMQASTVVCVRGVMAGAVATAMAPWLSSNIRDRAVTRW